MQCGSSGGDYLWEWNWGGDGRYYDGLGGIPSQYHNTDCWDDVAEEQRRLMGVGLGGCGTGGNRDFSDKGVFEEAAGKNWGICCREVGILTMHRRV